MALSEALAALIEESNIGFSRADNSIVLDIPLPPLPSRSVRLKLYGGRSPRGIHNLDGPAYMYPRCQVLVRGEPNQALQPEQDSYALFYILAGIKNRTIDETRFVAIDAVDYPVMLEVDPDERRSYVFNLEVNEGRR